MRSSRMVCGRRTAVLSIMSGKEPALSRAHQDKLSFVTVQFEKMVS